MEDADLTSWMGKPPEKGPVQAPRSREEDDISDESNREQSVRASDASSSVEEINYDGTPAQKPAPTVSMQYIEESSDENEAHEEQEEEDESLIEVIPQFQQRFFIDIPKMEEEEKEGYEYLPGHFTAKKILSQFRRDRYLVKLGSGEKQMVSPIIHQSFL